MKRFINWLSSKISPQEEVRDQNLRRTGAHLKATGRHQPTPRVKPKQAVPERQPEFVELDPRVGGRIEGSGPGKNVLIRNKYVREDTGTHETLTILDDSLVDTEEEAGFDPYNTGQFDRSRNWDKRTK
jgi:hypothetical protein